MSEHFVVTILPKGTNAFTRTVVHSRQRAADLLQRRVGPLDADQKKRFRDYLEGRSDELMVWIIDYHEDGERMAMHNASVQSCRIEGT